MVHAKDCLISQEVFAHGGFSIVKTVVMMIGELDFASMFAQGVTHTGISPTFLMPYPGATVFFFCLFLVLLPILFMNLLVGLAVDNIQSVQEKGPYL